MSRETPPAAILRDLRANLPKGKKGKKLIPLLPMLAEIMADHPRKPCPAPQNPLDS